MPDGWRERFEAEREALNRIVLDRGTLEIKRFFALDQQAYQAGALAAGTKELIGLAASLVLRCDDCIAYHIARCVDEGARREEIYETFTIALVVGGSIVIPHLRRAAEKVEELCGE